MLLFYFFITILHPNFIQKGNVPQGNIQSIVEYRMDANKVLTETITREYLKDGKIIFYQNEKPKEEPRFIKNEYTEIGYLSTQETNEHKAVYEYVQDSILAKISYYQSEKLSSFEEVEFDAENNREIRVLRGEDGALMKTTTVFFKNENELIRKEIVLLSQNKVAEKITSFYKKGLEHKRIYEFDGVEQKNREIHFYYNKNDKLIRQMVKGSSLLKIRKKYNRQGDLLKEKRFEQLAGNRSLSKKNYIYEYDFNNHWIKMVEYKDGEIIGKRTRTITYFP